ncbi:MAG TPA: sensor histidine kinase [Gemmatimonadaceae bacterium]|nr:sensor histidine kinase [Gemmatimonadaceae bacterium]
MAPRGGVRLAALRAPLAVKIIGAHALVVGLLGGMLVFAPSAGWSGGEALAAVGTGLLVYVGLVLLALKPVNDIERVAARVWKGDLAARVAESAVAGTEVLRIGSMFNALLDQVMAERGRLRTLAAGVVNEGDLERAALARQLHDSTAQQLAALLMQLSAIARDFPDPELAPRLALLRTTVNDALSEIRLISETIHPRVLEDLGLAAALEMLAREAAKGTGVAIAVHARSPIGLADIPPASASVLYSVARESVRNALSHGDPGSIDVTVDQRDRAVVLEVCDDGQGFDAASEDHALASRGLFTMRERLSLVGGDFQIQSAPGKGTTVLATVPMTGDSPTAGESTTL